LHRVLKTLTPEQFIGVHGERQRAYSTVNVFTGYVEYYACKKVKYSVRQNLSTLFQVFPTYRKLNRRHF